MIYKNGVTFAELQIESVTDETCGTYVCTASAESTTVKHKTGTKYEELKMIFRRFNSKYFLFDLKV